MPRSNLCHYSDVYIVVKVKISVTGANAANRRKKNFKNKPSKIMLELRPTYQK